MKNTHRSMVDYKNYLTKVGINPSYQRLKILERLDTLNDHPSVNDIYMDLIDEIPSLSKTTVYNTLNLFMENGIARSIDINDHESRYDLLDEEHCHFACLKCKSIKDIPMPPHKFDLILGKNYQVLSTSITIKGICEKCTLEERKHTEE